MANVLQYTISLNAAQAQSALASFQQQLASAMSAGAASLNPAGLNAIPSAANRASGAVSGLAGSFMSLRGLIGAVVTGEIAKFAKETVDAAATAESAFKGLESVANRSGVGIEKSWRAVQELSADGILSQSQAATALKNLFARGFGLEESVNLIKAFRDAAAFGRQASLEWGDAVVTATEGIKNENSALVDNAGVTKNVAKMWEDYAKAKGISYNDLTQQQKREAEYNGVLQETAKQTGDTAKALEGLQGTNARMSKSWTDLKTTIGSGLTPAYQALGNSLGWLTDKTADLLKVLGKVEEVGNPFRVVADGFTAFSMSGPGANMSFEERLVTLTKERVKKAAGGVNEQGRAFLGLPPPPPIPPANIAIPALGTNKTGIAVMSPGPDGRPLTGPTTSTAVVRDNIDQAAVDKDKAAKAKEEAEGLAKQQLNKRQKQLQLSKQAADDELAIYKSGLEAQKAALDAALAKNPQMRQAYAKQAAELERQELEKSEELRGRRVRELQEQLDLAKRTGNKDTEAEAQQALDSELAQGKVNANKLKELRIQAGRAVFEADKQTAEERRRLDEQLLQARINAERTTSDALRERELAAVQALFDQRLITEEEYIRRQSALRDKALQEELARLKAQQAFLEQQKPADAAQANADKAKREELAAQVAATEAKREQLTTETDAKIVMSARQTAQMRADLEVQLLEAEGKAFEARSAMIDNWLAEKRAELAAFPDLLARAEAVASAQKRQNGFDRVREGIGTLNSDYDAKQAEVQRRSQQGLLTDIQLDQESLRLKREQAAALRERLELLKQNANGSTANAEAIKEVERQIADLDGAMSETAKSINDMFFAEIEQGFKDLVTGAKSPLDALRSMLSNVLSSLASMLLKNGLQSLLGGALGGGGGIGGMLASFFGGFRASGGDVAGGTAYIVGERGPELYFPGANGRVVSNAQIQQALLGVTSRRVASPIIGGTSGRQYAPAPAPTVNNRISPRVYLTTKEVRDALREDHGFERDIVDISVRNRRRINSGG